jgi:hypothetical protein
MTDTNRKEFGIKLQNHDWFYEYSDDHRYWTAGVNQKKILREYHKNLTCPYSFDTLFKWANNMILEQFAEEKPDEWYRQPHKFKSTAASRLADLMSQEEWDIIQAWFDNKH